MFRTLYRIVWVVCSTAVCFTLWKTLPTHWALYQKDSQIRVLQGKLEKAETQLRWSSEETSNLEYEVKQLKCQLKRRFPTIRDFLGLGNADECSYEEI
ncbi:hypothetical protein [Fischerella sp. PCC 9605]|uniref:hypothetical protein n=1 Tax=Fischerella sp. PCC 9605 TaxID=1173024 RepID=UPI000478EB97|nr:hypothetical protein [Fischerella sp. PCC 9605]